MNPKHIAIVVLLLAALAAFKWYGSSMYDAGVNAERVTWQDRELVEKGEGIDLVTGKLGEQKVIQGKQLEAERAASAKTIAALERKLRLKGKVKIHVKENVATECLDTDRLRLANEILTGS